MLILDTHAWLWWVTNPVFLSSRAAKAIVDASTLGIPAMVCWEMALLVDRKRIELSSETTYWLHTALSDPRAALLPITPEIAVRANSFGDSLHRDPADRLIVATAMELNAPIVTRDQRIQAFAGVETLW